MGEPGILTVHHLRVSQSDRIVWLCEELGLDYNLICYDRVGGGPAPAEYKALSPYGVAPVIQDGDLTLSESGAIVEYLIHKYGDGRLAIEPTAYNYPDYLQWLHFANASFMAGGGVALAFHWTKTPVTQLSAALSSRYDRAFEVAEQRLKVSPYFAGPEFTAADLMMNFPLTTMRRFAPFDISGRPVFGDYLRRIAARPAFKRAREKGEHAAEPYIG